ncbi:hypothetical protein SMUL_0928 [Sulfurospirillum multivorans DSM 12446]|uniref:Uncharacterized protein n=1 Tax=Sulfurospirillum multivorans (strain DM 12446 / JCM 15788 / NBRC 109480) TaxID=1150621 RepID=A0AA86DZ90_SULMK|nr:hypothetical protein SMUL_0928 [Sulfurospirillum multivorans DSM 12446]
MVTGSFFLFPPTQPLQKLHPSPLHVNSKIPHKLKFSVFLIDWLNAKSI